jgi:ubiquinone/menaquinone biosynthesis C-methylase UbiE
LKTVIKKIFGLRDSGFGTDNETFREKWIIESLKKIPAGARILDAGAGEQQFRKYCQHLNYVSQDIAQYTPVQNGSGLQMEKWDFTGIDIVSDIINIPEPGQSFDAILCTEVIEHIPDPAKVFPEFARLLKPGGVLIITAPFSSLTHFAPYYYSTGFSSYFYEKHLADNDFEIGELIKNGNYFQYLAQEASRIPHIAEKYTDVKLNFFHRMIRRYFLNLLKQLSDRDTGSQELMCFGIQVIARKK